ncbi:MAG: hypothetical protein RMN53_11795 [Anaerolineae bacterium]|nr:hypothetical protein [Anaerolineae bacterium]
MATNEQEILHGLQDDMVLRAENLVRSLRLSKDQGVVLGKTQASKALEVVQSAGSLSVFVNWLRYQAGREGSAEFWTKPTGSRPTLAQALTDELKWLQGQIAQRMSTASKADQQRVTMRAATRFMGYFRRALIGADHLEQIALEKGG